MTFDDDEQIYGIQNGAAGLDNEVTVGNAKVKFINVPDAQPEERKLKVLVELTGKRKPKERYGLDLVMVLDISENMNRQDRLEKLKKATEFVIKKLGPIDRVSVVTFSVVANRLCGLRQINKESRKDIFDLVNGITSAGGANISEGLEMALQVLSGRKIVEGRSVGIILMSSGEQDGGRNAAEVELGNVPIYTFGFGTGNSPTIPHVPDAIAKKRGGQTLISDVQITSDLTVAFAKCFSGLLTVAVQDLKLILSPENMSRIENVYAGEHEQSADDSAVSVMLGNLYDHETRRVLVHVLPPLTNVVGLQVLKVAYKYRNEQGKERKSTPLYASKKRIKNFTPEEIEYLMDELINLERAHVMNEARALASINLPVAEKNVNEDTITPPSKVVAKGDVGNQKQAKSLHNSHTSIFLAVEDSHVEQEIITKVAASVDGEKLPLVDTSCIDADDKQARLFDKIQTNSLPGDDDNVQEETTTPSRATDKDIVKEENIASFFEVANKGDKGQPPVIPCMDIHWKQGEPIKKDDKNPWPTNEGNMEKETTPTKITHSGDVENLLVNSTQSKDMDEETTHSEITDSGDVENSSVTSTQSTHKGEGTTPSEITDNDDVENSLVNSTQSTNMGKKTTLSDITHSGEIENTPVNSILRTDKGEETTSSEITDNDDVESTPVSTDKGEETTPEIKGSGDVKNSPVNFTKKTDKGEETTSYEITDSGDVKNLPVNFTQSTDKGDETTPSEITDSGDMENSPVSTDKGEETTHSAITDSGDVENSHVNSTQSIDKGEETTPSEITDSDDVENSSVNSTQSTHKGEETTPSEVTDTGDVKNSLVNSILNRDKGGETTPSEITDSGDVKNTPVSTDKGEETTPFEVTRSDDVKNSPVNFTQNTGKGEETTPEITDTGDVKNSLVNSTQSTYKGDETTASEITDSGDVENSSMNSTRNTDKANSSDRTVTPSFKVALSGFMKKLLLFFTTLLCFLSLDNGKHHKQGKSFKMDNKNPLPTKNNDVKKKTTPPSSKVVDSGEVVKQPPFTSQCTNKENVEADTITPSSKVSDRSYMQKMFLPFFKVATSGDAHQKQAELSAKNHSNFLPKDEDDLKDRTITTPFKVVARGYKRILVLFFTNFLILFNFGNSTHQVEESLEKNQTSSLPSTEENVNEENTQPSSKVATSGDAHQIQEESSDKIHPNLGSPDENNLKDFLTTTPSKVAARVYMEKVALLFTKLLTKLQKNYKGSLSIDEHHEKKHQDFLSRATRKFKGILAGISNAVTTQITVTWTRATSFAYSYSPILLIQDALRSPPSGFMIKVALLGVAAATVSYMLCVCFSSVEFRDLSPPNILNGFGLYNPFWLLDIAILYTQVLFVGAYQAYHQPLFEFVDKHAARTFPNNKFINKKYHISLPRGFGPFKLNLFCLVWRTAFVILTTSILMHIPFFNDVVCILGAFGFWPLTVCFLVEMYVVKKKIPKWSSRWISLQILSVACLNIATAAAAGSFSAMVNNLKVYRPFQTSY